MDNNHMWPY